MQDGVALSIEHYSSNVEGIRVSESWCLTEHLVVESIRWWHCVTSADGDQAPETEPEPEEPGGLATVAHSGAQTNWPRQASKH